MVAERSMGWGDQEEAGLTGLESGRDSAGGMWLRPPGPHAGGPGFIPGLGTRAHVAEERGHRPSAQIPHAAVNIDEPECLS